MRVSYNDFGGGLTPFFGVQQDPLTFAFGPYTLPTSLPNNWWGVGCDQGGFPIDPVGWPSTIDPSPYAEPIAQAYRDGLDDDDDSDDDDSDGEDDDDEDSDDDLHIVRCL